MSEDGCNCLICHEPFLSAPVGALKCGHVYHSNCVVMWFTGGKKTCPVCKKKATEKELRTLDFDVKQVPTQSPEELRQLEAATLEERERRRVELDAEKAEVEAIAGKVDADWASNVELAQNCKRQRKELEQEMVTFKEEYLELEAAFSKATSSCSALSASIDAEAPRLQRKLPIKHAKDGDSDLIEERRKLRGGLRPAERSMQLHNALHTAMQQESEKLRDKKQREAQSKQFEDELRDLRQQKAQLQRELEERRSTALSQTAGSQMSPEASSQMPLARSFSSNSGFSSPSSGSSQRRLRVGRSAEDHQEAGQVARSGSSQSMEVATPHGIAAVRLEDDEDAAALYGVGSSGRTLSGARPLLGAPLKRTASAFGALPANKPSSGGGKFGALFGAGRTNASASATAAPPTGKPIQTAQVAMSTSSSMKAMFANRRA